jgi:multidrug resistance protein
MFSPAIPNVMAEFHVTSEVLGSFSVSMFILGYAIGPLFIAPLSELYGRAIMIHFGNLVFTIFQIGCAESNSIGTLIALRLFAGIGGSAVLSVGGGVIADSFRREQMGKATASFTIGPLLGPVVGPVIGGFVTQSLGWRWCFWLLTIAGGVLTVCAILYSRDKSAYSPTTTRGKEEEGNWR